MKKPDALRGHPALRAHRPQAERNGTEPHLPVVLPFILAQTPGKGKTSSASARKNRLDADVADRPHAPTEALEEHDEGDQKEYEEDNRQDLRALSFFARRHENLPFQKEPERIFSLHPYFLTPVTACHLLFRRLNRDVHLTSRPFETSSPVIPFLGFVQDFWAFSIFCRSKPRRFAAALSLKVRRLDKSCRPLPEKRLRRENPLQHDFC